MATLSRDIFKWGGRSTGSKTSAKKRGGLTPASREIVRQLSSGAPSSGKVSSKAKDRLQLLEGDGGFNWKNIGSGLLDALSVPGAVVTTSLTNAIQASKGDDLVSWKNLAGTFRGSKFQGGRGLLKSLGVENEDVLRWGGLATDIALDPLWFVGGGAVRAGAGAARFNKLKEAAEYGAQFKNLATQLGKSPTAESRMMDLAMKAEVAKAAARAEGVVPAIRLGAGRKTVDGVRVGRGKLVPLSRKPLFKKDVTEVAPRALSLSPLGAVFARGQDRSRAVSGVKRAELDQAIEEIGGVTEAVKGRVGAVMITGNADRKLGQQMKEALREAGSWDETHDKVLRLFTQTSRRQTKQLGWVSHRQQAAIMERFLRDKLDNLNASLSASSADLARVDEELARSVESIRSTRQAMLAKGRATAAAKIAAAQTDAQRLRQATDAMGQTIETTRTQLDEVVGKLALRHNDPQYARRLAPSNRGRRLGGPSPKDLAQQATQQRRTALMQQRRRLEMRLKRLENTFATASKTTEAAEKAAEKAVNKIIKKENSDSLKLLDKFVKYERDATNQYTKRREMLERSYGELSTKAERQLASEARVFAANNKLLEFTKGRRMELNPKTGRLEPTRKGKKTKQAYNLEQIHAKAMALKERGTYIQHAPDKDMLDEVHNFMNAQRAARKNVRDVEGSLLPEATKATKKRTVRSPWEAMTREQSIEQMGKAGIPEADAEMIAEMVASRFKFLDEPLDYTPANIPGITYRPEINGYALTAGREKQQYDLLLKQSFMDALKASLPDNDQRTYERMWQDLTKNYNTKRIPGSPAAALGYANKVYKGKKVAGDTPRLALWTSWLKAFFTVLNPGHYMMNAIGSWVNDLIVGNYRHALTGMKGAVPYSEPRRIATLDFNSPAMKKVYKLGDQELTGAQIATYSRLSGLGLGYTEAEIEMVAHIFEGTNKATGIARVMNRWNMNRENADRIWSWMNHIKSGDDPLTAAARVIRSKFDYNAATHFERIWARNLMLFYTWFKNNLVLQGYGIMARPGIYSTLNHVENSRPKDPAEPGWWKEAGGLYSPFGLITFGNPLADIYKLEFSQENARKNLLGAMSPFISSPLQMATNRDFFTGAELSKFSDQNVPSPAGYLLNPLGIGQPSRGKAEGDKSPAVPWYLAKLLKDFSGPYGSTIGNVFSNPDAESSPMYSIIPRLTGARVNPVEREKWERSLKARLTKKKADATRKRNYES